MTSRDDKVLNSPASSSEVRSGECLRRGEGGRSEAYADIHRISRLDVVVIVLILVVSVGLLWRISRSRGKVPSGSRIAVVRQGDTVLEEVDLEKDGEIALLEGRMQVRIEQGRLRVMESDCAKKTCMNMGWIQHPRQSIVCIPNKVLIEIESAETPFLDAVVR